MKIQTIACVGFGVAIMGLSGCSAMNTAISHRNLDVETTMSDTIFLKPLSPDQKVAFVDVHNTSNQSSVEISSEITSAIKSKGYTITDDPDSAHVLLQVNILKVGKSTDKEAKGALMGGYGGAISGATIGAATGALVGKSGSAVIGGGLMGGLVGTVADSMVTDTFYTMITDVQVSEKLPKGDVAQSETIAKTTQGTSTKEVTHVSSNSNWMQYRTRVVSTADKVNLTFADAKPALETQLSHAIANIL